jgi:cytosine/adenosine deaminase-related metal-dependent hydrolase
MMWRNVASCNSKSTCRARALGCVGACGFSTSPATEMMSGHGFASVQRWARHGLKPSISIDNETRMPIDLFTQMRALLMSDRMH